MWQWIWANIEALSAATAILASLGAGELIRRFIKMFSRWRRMFLASEKHFSAIVELLEPSAIDPVTGQRPPSLRETLGTLTSGMRVITNEIGGVKTELGAVKTGQQRLLAGMREILQDDKDPIFETDTKGNVVFANVAYLDLTGRQLQEVLGRGWEATVHRADRRNVVDEWKAAVDGLRILDMEFRIVARAGSIWRVKCVAKPLVCDDRVISGYRARFVEKAELKT